jgi:hypothetical protein
MKNIVAAQFDDFAHAEAAMRELRTAQGLDARDVAHVVLNAPGRHAEHPLGGDQDADAGASHGDKGALTGAVIGGAAGAVTGLAVSPVVGPVGAVATAAIGAYMGSLAGALHRMKDATAHGAPPPRPAGVMVMVHATTGQQHDGAVSVFRRQGARGIEEAEGEWNDGWTDFDPVSPPHWIVEPAPADGPGKAAA